MNLAAQLALIALLGRDGFAPLGLGLMAANSVCFLGDIGLSAYFLRETATSTNWLAVWRQSTGSRLLALSCTFAIAWLALLWSNPAQAETAINLLWFAAPGLLASAVNPLPLLFGQNRVRTASAGIVLRFVLQCGGALIAVWVFPDYAAAGIGLSFSLGLLAQVVLGQWAGLPLLALCPQWPRRLPPPAALRLWGLSLVGTISDRSLPFIIAKVSPEVLAVALIAIQGLQALTGVWSQMDRLLIPAAAKGESLANLWRGLRLLMGGMLAVVMAGVVVATGFYAPAHLWAGCLFAMEWGASLCGALAFTLAFARQQDQRPAAFMGLIVPVSIVLQLSLASLTGLEAILALRFIVALLIALFTFSCLQSRCVPTQPPAPPN